MVIKGSIIRNKRAEIESGCEKTVYSAPEIIKKSEILIELQTNVLPDEPPPPL